MSAPKQIEAGIQSEYPGRRIAEFWRTIGPRRTGEMTPRELCVLVEGLSDASWYKRSRASSWTLLEQFAAGVVNVLQAYRQDYRNAHGAEHDWTLIEMPELEHIRAKREAEEQQRMTRRQLAGRVFDAMLTGRLRMSEIDVNADIEEVLAAI
ncbi:hypothetical protein [Nocardia pseudovaccinii]|uniref:hypothetical protein n=1 Tax=Nocardia pseudovaccinii TaxID=189540 RepID=UPI0007A4E66A|nr:hypothetical protein [Nocardia pseudovaccinii]